MILFVMIAVLVMVPLTALATRSKKNRRGRFRGIDWNRGAADSAAADAAPPAEAFVATGIAHHRAGRFDDALADYDRALAVADFSQRADVLNNRGCLHRDRGDLARAQADLDEALRLAPDFAVAHVSLAEVLTARGEWDAAIASLARGIALDATWRNHAHTDAAFAALREARPTASELTA